MRWQASGPPLLGQRVEERVGRRVTRLPRRAQRAGRGGEQHEGSEVQVTGQLVEVPGGVHLGPQHLGHPLRGQGGHHRVSQHPGGVHHRGQRLVSRNTGQQCRERGPIGHVDRDQPRTRSQRAQFRHQLLSVCLLYT